MLTDAGLPAIKGGEARAEAVALAVALRQEEALALNRGQRHFTRLLEARVEAMTLRQEEAIALSKGQRRLARLAQEHAGPQPAETATGWLDGWLAGRWDEAKRHGTARCPQHYPEKVSSRSG